MAPNQVGLLSVGLVKRNLNGNVKSKVKFKFHVRDRVRISKSRKTFMKGYLPNWTEETFAICKRITKEHPIYKLMDDYGENSRRFLLRRGITKSDKRSIYFV